MWNLAIVALPVVKLTYLDAMFKKPVFVLTFLLVATYSYCQKQFKIIGNFGSFNGRIHLQVGGFVDSTTVRNGHFVFEGNLLSSEKAYFTLPGFKGLSYTPFILDPTTMIIENDTLTVQDKKPYLY